jgi:type I restriction enzyme M protein
MSSKRIVQQVWSFAHVLKDDGLAFMDYTEQITYLLFLKMNWELREQNVACRIPSRYSWGTLKKITDNGSLGRRYHQALRNFSEQPGLLGLIYAKPQSKINDPAKLRLLIEMIDKENWSALDVDVKGEVYEGLLARNAEDVRGGAGQYFTPRPVVKAIVQVMRPTPFTRIVDPACGTGGFLLAAYDWMKSRVTSTRENRFLHTEALSGSDIVSNVARLCAMNLYLHGLGLDEKHPSVSIGDSLAGRPERVDMVLTNPPFGKRSSVSVVSENGKKQPEKIYYEREDFWATTRNKQLNFLQHVWSMLKENGRAAVVVPDNVLFEAGAGETIRRNLLTHSDVHTLLRLPTGIWYSAGVKANVLFFDRTQLKKSISSDQLWIYDLRANKNFTLRENPISDEDLRDFVTCYNPSNRRKRRETERFRSFEYHELLRTERASLDISWLQDDSLSDDDHLPKPHALARAILRDLETAVREFAAVEKQLSRKV